MGPKCRYPSGSETSASADEGRQGRCKGTLHTDARTSVPGTPTPGTPRAPNATPGDQQGAS
eukprot:6226436-Pyramimonas_sp.AAC.1